MNRYSRPKAVLSLLLAGMLLCSLFSGCSSDSTGKTFRYDIEEEVGNLDPQFTTDPAAQLILSNLYEGLVVRSSDGEILPGVAKSYTVSEDNRTYTFHLRSDAVWQTKSGDWKGGMPVTSADFLFTFTRLFRDNSPLAVNYDAIEGAGSLQNGGRTLSGVQTPDDHTLVITLSEPDPRFLDRLCDPAAAPCNEEAFTRARGRYGLELQYVFSNGPFVLTRWDETRVQLRQNETYCSEWETVAGNVVFYIGRQGAEQFLDGKTDLALLDWEQQLGLNADKFEVMPIQKTVWCIVFNQNHDIWGNALLRQGLAHTVDRPTMAEAAPASFVPSYALAPDAMRVLGKPYRELAAVETPLEFDTQQGARLFEMGLESLGLKQLPTNITILIPDIARTALGSGELQQGWQQHLSAFINFEVLSAAQIQQRLRTGEFQMLLMPMTPGNEDIETLLSAFTSHSSQNYFGYRNYLYDDLMETAALQHTPEEAAAKYAQAETMLLSDAVVIPLYFETSYLATSKGVEDLHVSAFGDRITFKYAKKDN